MGQSPVWTMWLSEAWVITSARGEGLSKPGAGSPEAGKGTWGQWYRGDLQGGSRLPSSPRYAGPTHAHRLRPRRRLIQVSPPWGSERTVAPVRDPGPWPQIPVCCCKAKSLAGEQLSAGRSGELTPRSSLTDALTQQPLSSRAAACCVPAGLPHPEPRGEAQDPAPPHTGPATAARAPKIIRGARRGGGSREASTGSAKGEVPPGVPWAQVAAQAEPGPRRARPSWGAEREESPPSGTAPWAARPRHARYTH